MVLNRLQVFASADCFNGRTSLSPFPAISLLSCGVHLLGGEQIA